MSNWTEYNIQLSNQIYINILLVPFLTSFRSISLENPDWCRPDQYMNNFNPVSVIGSEPIMWPKLNQCLIWNSREVLHCNSVRALSSNCLSLLTVVSLDMRPGKAVVLPLSGCGWNQPIKNAEPRDLQRNGAASLSQPWSLSYLWDSFSKTWFSSLFRLS